MNPVHAPAPAASEASHELQAVLGCLADGLLVVGLDGKVDATLVDRGLEGFIDADGLFPWDGADAPRIGRCLWGETHEGIQFDLQWEQLGYGFLPPRVIFGQLPREARRGDRLFDVTAQSLDDDRFLLRFQDITDQAEDRRKASENEQFRKVVETMMQNIEASRGFFGETRWLLDGLGDADKAKKKQDLHTLKGNLATFGFDALATVIHEAEEALLAGQADHAETAIGALKQGWADQEALVGSMFASRADKEITLSREEYEEHVMMCMIQQDHAEMLGQVQRWALDPISGVFARFAMQAERAAVAAGKEIRVDIQHNLVRLPATGLEHLWANLVHLARNAIDHGIETPDAREAAGKPSAGTVTFAAEMTEDDVVITVADDGKGVDWDRVRAKAADRGLPHASHEELVAALTSDGFSTQDSADLGSGRGVGTAAVRAAIESLGGRIVCQSEAGQGTTWALHLPLASIATLGLLS